MCHEIESNSNARIATKCVLSICQNLRRYCLLPPTPTYSQPTPKAPRSPPEPPGALPPPSPPSPPPSFPSPCSVFAL